jgi:uncharacterized membrane protein YtjA (UPF0391 family)
MLQAAIAFFVLAIIAAIFGFGGIAAGATSIAKVLFFVFIVLFVFSFLVNILRGRTPTL